MARRLPLAAAGPYRQSMGRILLIVAAVIVGLMLLGPILGFAFTLLKWALIIGGIAFAAMFVTKWVKTNSEPRRQP
ncbi:hypothetical protein GCM10022248_47880 [Nonomuraea soli]